MDSKNRPYYIVYKYAHNKASNTRIKIILTNNIY
jgi:hypothetical protein